MEPDKMFFKLSKELEYSTKGEFQTTGSLEFRPPGIDEFKPSNRLAQLVTNAVLDARRLMPEDQNLDEIEQKNPTGNEIKVILLASREVDVNDIYEAFKPIALSTGTYDGNEKLQDTVFTHLGIEDTRRLICEYIANFTFPSLFSEGD